MLRPTPRPTPWPTPWLTQRPTPRATPWPNPWRISLPTWLNSWPTHWPSPGLTPWLTPDWTFDWPHDWHLTEHMTDPLTDPMTEHMAKAIPMTVCINDWPKLWCYCQGSFTLLGSNIQNGVKEIYLDNWKSCFFWRLSWMSGVLAWGWGCGNRSKYAKHRRGDLTCNTGIPAHPCLCICVMLNV